MPLFSIQGASCRKAYKQVDIGIHVVVFYGKIFSFQANISHISFASTLQKSYIYYSFVTHGRSFSEKPTLINLCLRYESWILLFPFWFLAPPLHSWLCGLLLPGKVLKAAADPKKEMKINPVRRKTNLTRAKDWKKKLSPMKIR